jgi:hypothetical protein
MNKTAVKKWRNALRSEKYTQGRKFCYNSATKSFCVLGVAEKEVGRTPLDEFGTYSLTHKTAKLLGLISYPSFLGRYLAGLNDSDASSAVDGGLNFQELADLLDIALIENDFLR